MLGPQGPRPVGFRRSEERDDRPVETDPVRLVAASLAPGRARVVLLARDAAGYAAACRLTTLRQVRPDFRLLQELPAFLAAWGEGVKGGVFRAERFADMTTAPVPRFDLLKLDLPRS